MRRRCGVVVKTSDFPSEDQRVGSDKCVTLSLMFRVTWSERKASSVSDTSLKRIDRGGLRESRICTRARYRQHTTGVTLRWTSIRSAGGGGGGE